MPTPARSATADTGASGSATKPPGTAASTANLYYESMHSGTWPTPTAVPTGVAAFAEDVAIRRYAEQGYNIVHWSDFDRGGHFAAMEAPDLLVGDVREFFRTLP